MVRTNRPRWFIFLRCIARGTLASISNTIVYVTSHRRPLDRHPSAFIRRLRSVQGKRIPIRSPIPMDCNLSLPVGERSIFGFPFARPSRPRESISPAFFPGSPAPPGKRTPFSFFPGNLPLLFERGVSIPGSFLLFSTTVGSSWTSTKPGDPHVSKHVKERQTHVDEHVSSSGGA